MNESPEFGLTLREPMPEEAERIGHLFRSVQLPASAQIRAAVRSQTIERFIAAVAFWTEGGIVRFRLVCQPGVPRSGVAQLLINCVEDISRSGGVHELHYAETLADDSEWRDIMRECGFESIHSERFFEVTGFEAWTRVTQMFERHKAGIPSGWRTESIRLHPPEWVYDLIGAHRLMPPEELRARWQEDCSAAFELDLSNLLFDGGEIVGALLLRRIQDALCLDVRVVNSANPRLRALGNICLLHHVAIRCGHHGGPIRWLRFRAGEAEHRETANLAFRMKGRELPPRHLFVKKL